MGAAWAESRRRDPLRRREVFHRLREGEIRVALVFQQILDALADLDDLRAVRAQHLAAERRHRRLGPRSLEQAQRPQPAPAGGGGDAGARAALHQGAFEQAPPLRGPAEAPGVGEDERLQEAEVGRVEPLEEALGIRIGGVGAARLGELDRRSYAPPEPGRFEQRDAGAGPALVPDRGANRGGLGALPLDPREERVERALVPLCAARQRMEPRAPRPRLAWMVLRRFHARCGQDDVAAPG